MQPSPTIKAANQQAIEEAAQLLKNGQVIGLPTETVYGLAADALNPAAVAKIFAIKERPFFDPLIVHAPSMEAAKQLVSEWPIEAQKLAEAFWPGPLTLVLPKKNTVPDLVTSGLPSVAIRVPSHPIAQEVLKAFGKPLAAPSANRFGRISPTTAEAVWEELGANVPLILEGGPCSIGLESTIISLTGLKPRLARAGGIPLEKLEACIGPIELPEQRSSCNTATPEAPGQLASHYAPAKPLVLLEPGAEPSLDPGKKAGLLCWGTPPEWPLDTAYNLSPEENELEAAANFFAMLRALDASDVEIIYAIALPDRGLGRAINDRLRRAAHSGETPKS